MLSHVQILATLWTGALQAPLSIGFPGQEYWSGLPFPPPGDLPDPGISCDSCIAGGFFTTELQGKTFIDTDILIMIFMFDCVFLGQQN